MNNNRRSTNKKILIGLGIVIVLIAIASMAGGTKTPAKTATIASKSSGKATYTAVLWNPANNDNTLMALPACGWDCGKGWDTAAQYAVDSTNPSAVQPAVIAKDSKTLEVGINVKNTGTAAGTPSCTVKASSDANNFDNGNYYGVKVVDVPMLNGDAIKPGNSSSKNVDLTISNNGAQYIKAISVNCN